MRASNARFTPLLANAPFTSAPGRVEVVAWVIPHQPACVTTLLLEFEAQQDVDAKVL